jgi:hypothetical protein
MGANCVAQKPPSRTDRGRDVENSVIDGAARLAARRFCCRLRRGWQLPAMRRRLRRVLVSGPTMDDHDYRIIDGVLHARKRE